jgi:hypothetical protein
MSILTRRRRKRKAMYGEDGAGLLSMRKNALQVDTLARLPDYRL